MALVSAVMTLTPSRVEILLTLAVKRHAQQSNLQVVSQSLPEFIAII